MNKKREYFSMEDCKRALGWDRIKHGHIERIQEMNPSIDKQSASSYCFLDIAMQ